jgi:outer membrane protein
MKNTVIYIIFFAIATLNAVAQQVWTLDDCISFALANNTDIRRQKIVIDKQAIQIQTDKLSRLPNLTTGGTQKYDFGRSLNRDNAYEDVNSRTSTFSLTTEIPLFTGFYIPNIISQHKLEQKAENENLRKAENTLALQVATAYFQILLNRDAVDIAAEQFALAADLEKITGALVAAGKAPGAQLLEVQSQSANDELNLVRAENTLRLSVIDLEQLMETAHSDSFAIAPVDDSLPRFLINPEIIYDRAERTMPEIRSANYLIYSREKAVAVAQAGYYPTLSLAAEINSGYYHAGNADNQSFNEQFKNNLQRTVYLTLRIPIFNRWTTRNAVRQARKDLDDSELQAENVQKTLYKSIQKTYYDALSARERHEASLKAVASAREALRYAKERYSAGRATIYEYSEARLKLANALSEQVQSKYQFLLQKYFLDFYAGNQIK